LVACYAISLQTNDAEFDAYLDLYNKAYFGAEYIKRLGIYQQSKEEIERLNENAAKGGKNTRFGINRFADLAKEEFGEYLGYKEMSKVKPIASPLEYPSALPVSFDWARRGAVTPVKDQGQCGSCWAFSTAEGVESAWFVARNQLLVLSPQQIISCDNGDGGCGGGDLPSAFAYVEANGLESEASYPYAPSDDTCSFNRSRVVATISGFHYATTTANETQMQVAMYTKGPLSVCVDASTWQFYTGGVMTNNCGQNLDHCVQITGWSVDNIQNPPAPYWIVRNSWSSNWGIRGYIFVERNSDLCGIANEATYATI